MLVVFIFFVGVLLGMDKANTGLVNMRGYDDSELDRVVSIQQNNGEVQASILGEEVSSHDLEEKKKKIQELKAFNFFSNLGKKATEGTKVAFDKALELLVPE
ncbi:MAG: DUF3679 domain-containing protein [Bacillus sp. (in: firmicutes)]